MKELTVRELHDAIMSLLVRPEPKVIPGDLSKMEIDWDQLRLLTQIKIHREGVTLRDLSQIIGLADTALGKFLHSGQKTLETNSLIRVMAWLGYTDFTDFLKEP